MRSRVLQGGFLFLLLVGVGARMVLNNESIRSKPGQIPSSVPLQRAAPLAKPSGPTQKSLPAQGVPASRVTEPASEQGWQEFLQEYGPGLTPEFAGNGRLVSIRKRRGESVASASDFDVQSSAQVRQRANEMIRKLHSLLQIREDSPLQERTLQTSPSSAQVFLSQTYQGMKVRPMGTVKVDLGVRGELLGLYSDYAERIQIVNRERLSLEEAKQRVQDGERGERKRVSDGQKIVWVTQGQGYISFLFTVNGFEWVIDAETGRVLSRKDVSIH